MFGYVRPARPELKVREWEAYQAAYCGLCHTIGRRYGLYPRFFLNYDFVFLAMLLSPNEDKPAVERRRCFACPHRKKCVLTENEGLNIAADESVILVYHQLRDTVRDSRFWKATAARLLSVLMKPAYLKAVGLRPEFDLAVRENLKHLSELEEERCPSLDWSADTFARLLQAAAPKTGVLSRDRAMDQLLYHVGRWIYLVDAWDDLEKDRAEGVYNPLPLRWPDGPEGHWEEMRRTLDGSLDLAVSAYHLLEFGCWSPILKNILCTGLPTIQAAVFHGVWKNKNKNTAGDDL